MHRRPTFRVFVALGVGEGGLVGVAAVLGWLFGLDPWATWGWSVRAAALGVLGVVPPLMMLAWLLQSSWSPAVELRARVEVLIREMMAGWRPWQFGLLALLAGLGEESLFRGVIQAGLRERCGAWGALLVAAVLFGLAHSVTRLYLVLAGVMGIWFGVLWWWTGSLLTPVLTHALYDFVALWWCVGRTRVAGGQAR